MTIATHNTIPQNISCLLSYEISYRPILTLLAVAVTLLHLIGSIWLLQFSDTAKQSKPLKIVQVMLAPKPTPKPIPKTEKPKPKIENLEPIAKKIPPKKQTSKPFATPAKEKTVVINKHPVVAHKPTEQPKPIANKTVQQPKVQKLLTSKPTTVYAPPAVAAPTKPWNPPTTVHTPIIPSHPTTNLNNKPTPKVDNSNGNVNVNSGVVELSGTKPNYPMMAKNRHIEGKCTVAFTITASGSISNAHAAGCSPPGVFENASLDAIQRFRFKPRIINGKPVNQNASKTFRFNLQ